MKKNDKNRNDKTFRRKQKRNDKYREMLTYKQEEIALYGFKAARHYVFYDKDGKQLIQKCEWAGFCKYPCDGDC